MHANTCSLDLNYYFISISLYGTPPFLHKLKSHMEKMKHFENIK